MLVSLSLQATPLDLSHVPARLWVPQPKKQVEMTEEEDLHQSMMVVEPQVPALLVPVDLDEVCLRLGWWADWEAFRELTNSAGTLPLDEMAAWAMDRGLLPRNEDPTIFQEKTLSLSLGSDWRSIPYLVSPKTPICYGCSRPLEPYFLRLVDEEWPERGWCPGCLLRRAWRVEWTGVRQDSRKGGTKFQQEETYMATALSTYLREWTRENRRWWEEQKSQKTLTYTRWWASLSKDQPPS